MKFYFFINRSSLTGGMTVKNSPRGRLEEYSQEISYSVESH
jgi:hypothetical protein